MPTVLELAGVAIPESVDGASLVPLLNGESIEREFVHAEHGSYDGLMWHMLTDGATKYVWHSADGAEQLFSLDDDPNELTDLADDPIHAATLTRWRERLIDRLAGRPEGFTDGGDLIPGRPHVQEMAHVSARE